MTSTKIAPDWQHSVISCLHAVYSVVVEFQVLVLSCEYYKGYQLPCKEAQLNATRKYIVNFFVLHMYMSWRSDIAIPTPHSYPATSFNSVITLIDH